MVKGNGEEGTTDSSLV